MLTCCWPVDYVVLKLCVYKNAVVWKSLKSYRHYKLCFNLGVKQICIQLVHCTLVVHAGVGDVSSLIGKWEKWGREEETNINQTESCGGKCWISIKDYVNNLISVRNIYYNQTLLCTWNVSSFQLPYVTLITTKTKHQSVLIYIQYWCLFFACTLK